MALLFLNNHRLLSQKKIDHEKTLGRIEKRVQELVYKIVLLV